MSYYIIEFFLYEIVQGLYIVRDGPACKYYVNHQVSKLVSRIQIPSKIEKKSQT